MNEESIKYRITSFVSLWAIHRALQRGKFVLFLHFFSADLSRFFEILTLCGSLCRMTSVHSDGMSSDVRGERSRTKPQQFFVFFVHRLKNDVVQSDEKLNDDNMKQESTRIYCDNFTLDDELIKFSWAHSHFQLAFIHNENDCVDMTKNWSQKYSKVKFEIESNCSRALLKNSAHHRLCEKNQQEKIWFLGLERSFKFQMVDWALYKISRLRSAERRKILLPEGLTLDHTVKMKSINFCGFFFFLSRFSLLILTCDFIRTTIDVG